MRLVTDAVARPVWAAISPAESGSKPIDDADGILFGEAQAEALCDGVEEHHRGVALLATDTQQSLDLIRSGVGALLRWLDIGTRGKLFRQSKYSTG